MGHFAFEIRPKIHEIMKLHTWFLNVSLHLYKGACRSVSRLHIHHNPLYPCTHEQQANHHISFLDTSSHLWSNPITIIVHITFLFCISASPQPPSHHQISFFYSIKIHEFNLITILMIISHVSYDYHTCHFKIIVHN